MPSEESKVARARKATQEEPEWSSLSSDEIEELVVKLARDGMQSAEIGTVLRDQYAVPDIKTATGKKVTEILDEHDLLPDIPEDLRNLMARAVNLREHLRENPKDHHNRRGLQKLESKIRSLATYYKEQEELPYEWTYSERTAKMLIE